MGNQHSVIAINHITRICVRKSSQTKRERFPSENQEDFLTVLGEATSANSTSADPTQHAAAVMVNTMHIKICHRGAPPMSTNM